MVANSSCGTPIQRGLRSPIRLSLSTRDSTTHDRKIRWRLHFSFQLTSIHVRETEENVPLTFSSLPYRLDSFLNTDRWNLWKRCWIIRMAVSVVVHWLSVPTARIQPRVWECACLRGRRKERKIYWFKRTKNCFFFAMRECTSTRVARAKYRQRLVGGRGGGVDSLTGVGFSPTCCTHSEPNIEAKSLSSGGGIGYIPIAISTSDNPSDQMSLCTE